MRTAGVLISTAGGLALALAACGGTAGRNAPGKYAASLAYSRCMRSQGVSAYPDPKQVGGEIQISGSRAGMNPRSPLFVSAQQSCRHLLPHAGEPTHADRQREVARLLRISNCMRDHRISGFPDPTLSPPADRAGYSDIMSNDGVWLEIPNSVDVRSPTFGAAAAACNLAYSPAS